MIIKPALYPAASPTALAFLSVPDAAAMLRVPISTVRALVARGELAATRRPNGVYAVHLDAVLARLRHVPSIDVREEPP